MRTDVWIDTLDRRTHLNTTRQTIDSRRNFLYRIAAAGFLASCQPRLRAFEIPISGVESPLTVSIDRGVVGFMDKHQVPGASIAISYSGKLLYARGFGIKDRSDPAAVTTNSLFRIASLSKPITAVAILQLIQNKKLKLEDRVCDVLGLANPTDVRWNNITVHQLLHHTGGWDSMASFDPMFSFHRIAKERGATLPLGHSDVIEFMLTQPLDFEPGSRYSYSNFGYCLLGRIIERQSGQSYESFVQESIFNPIGISTARLGRTLRADRLPDEVVYHDEVDRKAAPVVATTETQVSWPYGASDLSAMDSHGGWVATASELVRFASAFDAPKKSKLLTQKSIDEMFAIPRLGVEGTSAEVGYGCGWQIRQLANGRFNTWHNGELPGTSALMVRRHDGFCWAVLFNARADNTGTYLPSLFDPLMHAFVDEVKRWPKKDLFRETLKPQ